MAKKAAHKPAKKRKTATIAPKEDTEEGVPIANIGSVSLPVEAQVWVPNEGPFNELVIEWGCLGLSEEPDKITEVSANNGLLDPKRLPTTSEEGLHVYFHPPLSGAGLYGFKFLCTYNEAAEARTAAPKKKDEDDITEDEEAA